MPSHPGRVVVSASQLAERSTLEVQITGLRAWRWRLRLALHLIRIAVRIAGIGFRYIPSDEDKK